MFPIKWRAGQGQMTVEVILFSASAEGQNNRTLQGSVLSMKQENTAACIHDGYQALTRAEI